MLSLKRINMSTLTSPKTARTNFATRNPQFQTQMQNLTIILVLLIQPQQDFQEMFLERHQEIVCGHNCQLSQVGKYQISRYHELLGY